MPVDHPAAPLGAVRRVRARTLTLALGFLLTLGLLMALAPLIHSANILN